MKIFLVSFIFFLFSFSSFAQLKQILFNDNWEFQINAADPVTVVNLPHSPKLEPLVMKGQFLGKVVYRKRFDYPLEKGRHLSIHFEGAMHTADIVLNGQLVGSHVGGYLPFDVDLTVALRDSANILEVYLDNREDPTVPPGKPIKDLDFYYHAGIYRNVWLLEASGVQIQNPYFQTINANAQFAEIQLEFDLRYEPDWIILPIQVEAKLGETVIQLTNEQFLDSTNTIVYKGSLKLNTPKLWSPTAPNRYDLTINVICAGDTLAKKQLKVGIRKPELKADGFYLNGEKLFLSGTNRHQEYPYVGYAVPDNAQKRDAQLIKEAGFNFVRLSHYPQAPAFYDACDELGIIVMDAIAGWQFFGPAPFEQRCKNDLRTLISRDRNNPSVIFWENSLNETEMSETFMLEMNQIAKEQLGNNGFTAGWIDHPSYDVFIPARQHAKAPNYWAGYKPKAKAMLIAEYGDWEYYAQNAGFNQTQFADLTPSQRNSRHLRSASEQALLQQAFNFQEASNSNRKGANIIGEANWVCFDYNRGYSPDLEASGIYDITRLPKYAVGFYKSQLLDVSQKPFVQIANNWTALSPTTVTVFSNCPQVALYLNDSLIGKKQALRNTASDALVNPPYLFEIKAYNPGKLSAIGLDNKQKTLQTASIQTPQKPVKIALELATLETGIDTAKADLVFVRAKLLDANGTVVPTNDYKVTFSVQAQDAGLMSPAIQQVEAGIASALLRTEAPQTEIVIKVNLPLLGLSDQLIWKP
ncbi:MAG: glycoside hydrolase family 2 TIM barrel-domain containing protein [Sphingomonadales bacterium]